MKLSLLTRNLFGLFFIGLFLASCVQEEFDSIPKEQQRFESFVNDSDLAELYHEIYRHTAIRVAVKKAGKKNKKIEQQLSEMEESIQQKIVPLAERYARFEELNEELAGQAEKYVHIFIPENVLSKSRYCPPEHAACIAGCSYSQMICFDLAKRDGEISIRENYVCNRSFISCVFYCDSVECIDF